MKQHSPEYLATLRTHENGNICCDAKDVKHRCAKCQDHAKRTLRNNSQENTVNDYTPPDAYGPALKALREATATPMSRFEDRYRAERTKELSDSRAASAAASAALTPTKRARLTAAQAAKYAPPDPYAAGLAAMKENR